MQLNVKSGNIEYDKHNELLSWSFSNVKVVANSFGEIKVDKKPKARSKRIDPVDACINVHLAYMKFKEDIVLEAEMVNYLEVMGWNG
jgi:phage terminase large subunit-like protein